MVVLTTFPFSLLGGAQDGMVLNKPVILSDQPTLREYFTKGAVFVENTTEGIIAGIKDTQAREQQLIGETSVLLDEKQKQWETNFRQLLAVMGKSDSNAK